MTTQWERQELRGHAYALRIQARLTCQETGMTYTQAQLTALQRVMPGATALTCEITAAILTQRGLLDDP